MGNVTAQPDVKGFALALRRRIDAHFDARPAAQTGDALMWSKIVVGFGLFMATYATLGLYDLGDAAFLAVYVLHGATHLFLVISVAHDANHGAISRYRQVNQALSWTMDLCGISSFMWRVGHHRAHHNCVNLPGHDDTIDTRGLLRLSPGLPRRRWHRWQHLYVPFVYCLLSLDFVLVRDFVNVLASDNEAFRHVKRSPRLLGMLIASKAAYLGYMVIIPAYLFGYGLVLTLTAFILAHAVMGLWAAVAFQTTHVVDGNSFPRQPGELGDQVAHTFAATADLAAGSRVINFWTGGLNAHVIHHLLPGICHTHYPALSGIMRDVAETHGVPYKENPGVVAAVKAHLRLLRRLGRN